MKNISKSRPLNMDRELLALTNSRHGDDQIDLRTAMTHIGLFGNSGTGKTSTVGYYLAEALLNKKGLRESEKIGMVIPLYKSSDMKDWLRWTQQAGRSEDVIIIDEQHTHYLNFMDFYKDKESISAVDALSILSGLSLEGSNKNAEKFWEQASRTHLFWLVELAHIANTEFSILTLHALHQSVPRNVEQLMNEEFLNQSFCYNMLAQAADAIGSDHPRFQRVEQYFLRILPYMPEKTQGSILAMVEATLSPFIMSPMLQKLFCSQTTVTLDEMLRGKIVILNLPIQRYGYSGKVAAMLFKYIMQKKIESRDVTVSPNPVIFWIDEFQHYIHATSDALFLSTARSSRAGCVLITQNLNGLFAQVGGSGRDAEERVNSLIALLSTRFYLAQASELTNKMASHYIGQGKRSMHSTQMNLKDHSGSGGVSETFHPIMPPRQFTMLKTGQDGVVEAIVTSTGKRFSNGKNYLKIGFQQPWQRG